MHSNCDMYFQKKKQQKPDYYFYGKRESIRWAREMQA